MKPAPQPARPLTTAAPRFTVRVPTPQQVAEFFGRKVTWYYMYCPRDEQGCPLVFDTWNPRIQQWLDQMLGWEGAGAATAYPREGEK